MLNVFKKMGSESVKERKRWKITAGKNWKECADICVWTEERKKPLGDWTAAFHDNLTSNSQKYMQQKLIGMCAGVKSLIYHTVCTHPHTHIYLVCILNRPLWWAWGLNPLPQRWLGDTQHFRKARMLMSLLSHVAQIHLAAANIRSGSAFRSRNWKTTVTGPAVKTSLPACLPVRATFTDTGPAPICQELRQQQQARRSQQKKKKAQTYIKCQLAVKTEKLRHLVCRKVLPPVHDSLQTLQNSDKRNQWSQPAVLVCLPVGVCVCLCV